MEQSHRLDISMANVYISVMSPPNRPVHNRCGSTMNSAARFWYKSTKPCIHDRMGVIKGPIHVDCLRADRATGYSQQSHKMAVLIVNKISSESYGHLLHCARIYPIDKPWSELLCADLTMLTQSTHYKTPSIGFHRQL